MSGFENPGIDPKFLRELSYPCRNPGDLTMEEIEDRAKENRMNDFEDGTNLQPYNGQTPLCRAIAQKNAELIDAVLAVKSTDVNFPNVSGYTPLAIICEHCPQFLSALLKHPDLDPNIQDPYGYSPLHNILQFNPSYLPELLAAKDLDLDNDTEHEGMTPLMYAIANRPDTVPMLLEAGADPNFIMWSEDVTALMVAAQDKPALIPLLLKHGATIRQKDAMCMVSKGKKVVEIMVQAPEMDMDMVLDDSGNTFLMFLVQMHPSLLPAALERNPDINKKNKTGATALTFAALHQPQLLNEFVAKGGDLEQRIGADSGLPLLHFIIEEKPAHVQQLLLAGADKNAVDAAGETALQLAMKIHPQNSALHALLTTE